MDITSSQGLPDDGSALCSFCEMTVFWLQVEFKKQRAKEKVFRYVNEVIFFFLPFWNVEHLFLLQNCITINSYTVLMLCVTTFPLFLFWRCVRGFQIRGESHLLTAITLPTCHMFPFSLEINHFPSLQNRCVFLSLNWIIISPRIITSQNQAEYGLCSVIWMILGEVL